MATRRTEDRRMTGEAAAFSGLRFATYARRSTDDARDADHTSVARQIEQARAYVERKGGEVLADHIYVDEDTSGAEFRARPGLLRLLNALENGCPFNAVVMGDDDRLGREQFETGYLLKQITDAGCRIFFYLDAREAVLDSATAKFMQAVRNFGSELEREKARQRSRDAAERKARQGFVTGGEPFGYENVHYKDGKEVPRGSPHDYVKRRIKADEAEVVRRVFRMYEAGYGQVVIAKTMNAHPEYAEQLREFFGKKPPAPPKHGSRSWAPAAIREMLYRRLYHGVIVWGRTTKTDRGGRAGVSLKRDKRDWLVVTDPSLKIVQDDLWDAVQDRLRSVNETYLRDCRGKLWSKPDLGREGKYLLTGLAECGLCAWNLAVLGGVRRVYGCTHYHRRGVCSNGLAQPVTLVDDSFLAELERKIMTPRQFREAVEFGVERVREELGREPDLTSQLERERRGLQQTLDKWEASPLHDPEKEVLILPKIRKAADRIKAINAELARLTGTPKLDKKLLDHFERQIAGELGRFADVLKGNIPRARQALKKLLVERVAFTPVDAGNGKQTYEFNGKLSYGAPLHGVIYSPRRPLGPPSVYIGMLEHLDLKGALSR